MSTKCSPRRWASIAVAGLMFAACGGSGESTPTPEELADQLLTAEDLGGDWSVEFSGALTDEI